MKKYIVEGYLDHNMVKYKTDDNVELEDVHAEPLLAIGRVKLTEDQNTGAAPAEKAAEELQTETPANTQPEQPAQPEEPIQPEASTPPEEPQQSEQPSEGQSTPEEIANTATQIQ